MSSMSETVRAIGPETQPHALTAVCEAPVLAGRELIRQLAFAYITGNGDAHAKNFSVVQDVSGERRVSPVYDVPCSHVYGDTTMALSIGGRAGAAFSSDDFVRLGQTLGVPQRATRRALAELAERADRWLEDLDQLPFDRGSIGKLRRVVEHRRCRLTR